MRAGQLDREITIDAWAPGEPDEYGNVQDGWTLFAKVRAQLIESSTDEFMASYGETYKRVLIFRIRYLAGVTTAHRFVYEGTALNVREIKEIGRRKGLELRCEVVS